jgi:prephenate dehydratase
MKIAIQGELGSFSHQAATELHPRARIVPCAISPDVFRSLQQGRVDAAVIPIENSLAGSVLEHYDLLFRHDCYIVREHSLRIVHNLITTPHVRLAQVDRVLSHPVALAQCRRFLAQHRRIVSEPFYDTAGSVKYIIEHRLHDVAAIAGRLAAEQYGGRILRTGIEDNRQNFTRFFLIKRLLRRTLPVTRGANKTSIAFALKNKPGTLYAAIQSFAEENISLSKIESRPVLGHPWEYIFYVDYLSGRTPASQRALKRLREDTIALKILGIYPSAIKKSES